MIEISNKAKLRFVNDHNLPIQVVEEPYFSYFLDLYENYMKSRTKFINFNKTLVEKFNSDDEKFLCYYYSIRDEIIKKIQNNKHYQEFNNVDISKYKINCSDISSKTNIYNIENVGKKFISIDLKKANFQAIQFFNTKILFPNDDKEQTYDSFISQFTDLDYFKESKYTRQIIFGQLNPSRQVAIEKYIMFQIYEKIKFSLDKNNLIRSITNDEIIIETKDDNFINLITEILNKEIEFEIRMEFFKLEKASDTDFFIKKDLVNLNNYKLIGVPVNLFAQVYKRVNNLKIDETKDLVFYNDKMLARYLNKI